MTDLERRGREGRRGVFGGGIVLLGVRTSSSEVSESRLDLEIADALRFVPLGLFMPLEEVPLVFVAD